MCVVGTLWGGFSPLQVLLASHRMNAKALMLLQLPLNTLYIDLFVGWFVCLYLVVCLAFGPWCGSPGIVSEHTLFCKMVAE